MCFWSKWSNWDFMRNILDVTLMQHNQFINLYPESVSWTKYPYDFYTGCLPLALAPFFFGQLKFQLQPFFLFSFHHFWFYWPKMGRFESVWAISFRGSPKKWLVCKIQKIWVFCWEKKRLGNHFYRVKWSSIYISWTQRIFQGQSPWQLPVALLCVCWEVWFCIQY